MGGIWPKKISLEFDPVQEQNLHIVTSLLPSQLRIFRESDTETKNFYLTMVGFQ
jgi:hypothetical protein